MSPLSSLRDHGRLLAFGLLMCFCSSFGQTFFVSLFGAEIRGAFQLDHGTFGTLYSAGTLLSAALLIWLGRLIDRMPLPRFAAAVLVGLAGACVLMASAWGPVALLAAFVGLRLFGQGLASHTGLTAMARYFEIARGRAISVASLGHPAGEAVLPSLVVLAIAAAGWRTVWMAAGIALLAAVPLVLVLLRGHTARDRALEQRRSTNADPSRDRALGQALRDPGLWLRLPALLATSFIGTGLIFHQAHLAQSKDWPLSLLAGSFTVYAAASVGALMIAGALVDRLSARRLVPVFLTPLALSCLTLTLGDAPILAPAFLGLLGVSAGFTGVLVGALWAELYGITHLGAIRAFGHTAMVVSTGLAPAVMGLLIDRGVTLETIAQASAVFCVAASLLATAARPPSPATVPSPR